MPRPVGRPKSEVETEVIAVRIPVELRERLDRYLDRLETETGIKANRNSIVRHTLKLFLDAQGKATPGREDGLNSQQSRKKR
jgi:hypothetical protein